MILASSIPHEDHSSGQPKPQPPPAPVKATNEDPAVTRLKALALQAKRQGDMAKAKEYIVQLRV